MSYCLPIEHLWTFCRRRRHFRLPRSRASRRYARAGAKFLGCLRYSPTTSRTPSRRRTSVPSSSGYSVFTLPWCDPIVRRTPRKRGTSISARRLHRSVPGVPSSCDGDGNTLCILWLSLIVFSRSVREVLLSTWLSDWFRMRQSSVSFVWWDDFTTIVWGWDESLCARCAGLCPVCWTVPGVLDCALCPQCVCLMSVLAF